MNSLRIDYRIYSEETTKWSSAVLHLWNANTEDDAIDQITDELSVELSDSNIADEEISDAISPYGLYIFRVIKCGLSDEYLTGAFKLGFVIGEYGTKVDCKWFYHSDGTIGCKKAEGIYPNPEFVFHSCKENEQISFVLEKENNIYYSDSKILKKSYDDESNEEELIRMVEKVYEKQPLLLLSVFQKAPLEVFLGEDSNIRESFEKRIELIDQCVEVYRTQFTKINKAKKFKLSEYRYIDRIDKLTCMTSDTLRFIAQNPQYLIEVKRKKGVCIPSKPGKVYLPEKTIVRKNVVDYYTYENCYILSFLKMLSKECENLRFHLCLLKAMAEQERKNQRLKSKQADFDSLIGKCEHQLDRTMKSRKQLRLLNLGYEKIFRSKKKVKVSGNVKRPRLTAIFRQLPEYNVFYTDAFMPWFEYGIKISDLDMKDKLEVFTTAVSNPSTAYELYFVVKCLDYIVEQGYTFDSARARFAGIHEKESRYKDYAYEFPFHKDSSKSGVEDDSNSMDEKSKVIRDEITFFYSPSVYMLQKKGGEVSIREENVDHLLIRNTEHSEYRDADESNGVGGHWEPDFILKYRYGEYDTEEEKWEKGSLIRYIMADAKHKDYDTVMKKDIRELHMKYINSISIFSRANEIEEDKADVKIAGLYAIYNRHSDKLCDENFTDYFPDDSGYGIEERPFTRLIYLNVEDDENEEWKGEDVFVNVTQDMKSKYKKQKENQAKKDTEMNELQRINAKLVALLEANGIKSDI